MILQAIQNEPLTVHGEGQQTRSFCYVSDLIEGIARMMEKEKVSGPVNLGYPNGFTINQLVELIIELTDHLLPSHKNHSVKTTPPVDHRISPWQNSIWTGSRWCNYGRESKKPLNISGPLHKQPQRPLLPPRNHTTQPPVLHNHQLNRVTLRCPNLPKTLS